MFGSIEIKTRPLRLAFLVAPNNAEHVREAIRIASTLWGGAYFPIIPLYKRIPATWRDKPLKAPPAKSIVQGYIEAFDPDVLVQMGSNLPAYISDTGLEAIRPDQIWGALDEGAFAPRFGIGIFEILHDVFEKYFRYRAKYPVEVVIPKIPARYPLFWTSLFGEFPAKLAAAARRDFQEPLDIRDVEINEHNLANLLHRRMMFPRRLTEHGIRRSRTSRRRRTGSVFFLDASKVEDVIDFWNLRALGAPVLPVPKQLQVNVELKQVVAAFLRSHRRHWRHNPAHCDFASFIRSRNTMMHEMEAYANSVRIDREPDDPSYDPFYALQNWYPRVWDEWARDKDGAVPDDIYGDGEESVEIGETENLRVRFRSLLPPIAKEFAFHGEARCANEIGFRFYGQREYLAEVFPKSSGKHLLRAISGIGSFGEWRVGRNGLVKLVRYAFNDTRNIPAAEDVFFAWLADLGWKPSLSPPGLLAKQIYRQTRGFPGFLANEKLLGLLEHMNGGSVNQDGSPAKVNVVNQERDLEVGEVKRRLRGGFPENKLHDSLISMGVFRLGLRVRCPQCLRHSWFSLESIRDVFTCPRCLHAFPAIGNTAAAKWCYKTAGPFSLPKYADGAYAVLLTLRLFNDRSMITLQSTPVMSFHAQAPGKKELEADFALFWRESVYGEPTSGLLFGECKTYGHFESKDFERMRYLASTFPGAVLVFSTLRKSLSKEEIVQISRIAKAGRKYWKAERPINPVLVLTGTELFDSSAPPYCWDKATRERFRNSRGLLGLCDATQQLYLKLPSWHTEWHEKWERRAQRAKSKQQVQPQTQGRH